MKRTPINQHSKNTKYKPADGETTEEFVTEGFGLGNGAKTSVVDLFGVKLNGVLREVESLLNEGGELTNSATLLTQDVLGTSGTDDDFSAGGGDTDFDTRVTFFGQLLGQERVELSEEDTVSDKLSPLVNSSPV
jgi:hypothetical protein